MSFLTKLFGTKNDRDMKAFWPNVNKINEIEPKIKALSDSELKGKIAVFKDQISNGASLDSLLVESFAVCREAAWRVLGMRHYDVQLIGGMVLHQGSISEMKTGEGKTLVATLPVFLNSLSGLGVHVVTVNDYLASRDAEWMGQVYRWLGLTTGIIKHGLSDQERQAAYGADITYATNNELGFDFLRDNMKFRLESFVQRKLNYAIVDECDSILIDEARTPLIISGPTEDDTDKYKTVNKIVEQLKAEVHFTMEEKNRSVALTDEGNSKVEQILGVENLYDPQSIDIVHHIYQGLKAHHLFKKDVDYMVKNGEVMIVDEFTGRLMEGRSWSDGLHQAVEAKEGVSIKKQNQTMASITFQNYFRMYDKLSGMTGTADTEAVEFKKIYNLDVFVIPTNKPIQRKDNQDTVYKTEEAKYKAIINDIITRQKNGQPVLVGTANIEKSEVIDRALTKAQIPHSVLNAKFHEKEAEIVAQAGREGRVTIATNMAGRGTDIVLGGNPEFLAKKEVEDESDPAYQEAFKKYQVLCQEEKQRVLDAGGLYIVGTERHESRRIDNQLRGRSGRQGDPGESCFYLSLEDDLMRKFGGDRMKKMMDMVNMDDDEPMAAGMVSKSIENAQKKVEGHNFDIRKHLLEYDDVMNQQRNSIYGLRKKVLQGDGIEKIILEMLGDVTSHHLDVYSGEQTKKEHWDLDGLRIALDKQFGLPFRDEELNKPDIESLNDVVAQAIKGQYDNQKVHMDTYFDDVCKSLMLGAIDHWWKEHLQRIDRVRDWVNLKAYAQKDPLLEYKKEAFLAFEEMQLTVKKDIVEKLMKIRLVPEGHDQENFDREELIADDLEALAPKEQSNLTYSSGASEDESARRRQGNQASAGVSRSLRRKNKRRKIKKL